MIKPWTIVSSKPAGDYRIFKVRIDRKVSPRTGEEHDFYVIDCPNWVNVIATTPDDQLVMIEQYRQGSNTVELEIPGGMIDPGDASPAAAGVRELREETGYEGEDAQIIGSIFPNPAFMSNTCFTLFVKNCRPKHSVQWDHAEDIVNKLVPVADIPKLMAAGQIRHSLVAVALYHFQTIKAGR
ncbi:MAG TPA: NUDIX hydrolase [Verrucomicrobiae bacterium]|jgi:ADP-ribose pyrophosphatase|nr:NUDIX hydrolase [Verrucomicrobiae bacterium]